MPQSWTRGKNKNTNLRRREQTIRGGHTMQVGERSLRFVLHVDGEPGHHTRSSHQASCTSLARPLPELYRKVWARGRVEEHCNSTHALSQGWWRSPNTSRSLTMWQSPFRLKSWCAEHPQSGSCNALVEDRISVLSELSCRNDARFGCFPAWKFLSCAFCLCIRSSRCSTFDSQSVP